MSDRDTYKIFRAPTQIPSILYDPKSGNRAIFESDPQHAAARMPQLKQAAKGEQETLFKQSIQNCLVLKVQYEACDGTAEPHKLIRSVISPSHLKAGGTLSPQLHLSSSKMDTTVTLKRFRELQWDATFPDSEDDSHARQLKKQNLLQALEVRKI